MRHNGYTNGAPSSRKNLSKASAIQGPWGRETACRARAGREMTAKGRVCAKPWTPKPGVDVRRSGPPDGRPREERRSLCGGIRRPNPVGSLLLALKPDDFHPAVS